MMLNVAASQYIGVFSLPDSWMLSNKQYGDILWPVVLLLLLLMVVVVVVVVVVVIIIVSSQ